MAATEPSSLTAHLRRLAATRAAAGGLPDAELVRRYAEHRDEAAFEVLVWRHGPMVWATCRRVLRHHQDAEDAFQATFLALARNAASAGPRRAVGGWLHRVAFHAALKCRARHRPTEPARDVPGPAAPDPSGAELGGVVDEELERLPDHYRLAFVLCCLEGLTASEAARELGCAVGTVDSRLHAARSRLRDRLARRGFAPGALAGAGVALAVPPAVAASAVALTTAAAPPGIDRLAKELGGTLTVKTRMLVVAAALGVAGVAAAVWAANIPAPPPPPSPPATPMPAVASVTQHDTPALLFTELVLKPGETGSHTLRLVRATFRDGKLASRDGLLTADASEFGYQSRYRLIDGRYVVLQSATVVDAREKKVVHSFDRGLVAAVEGPVVYFHNVKDGGEPGVYRYDAGTGVRERVAPPGAGRWGLRGAVSPAGTKAVVREVENVAVLQGAETPYTLALDRPGQPLVSLGKFAATCGMTGAGWVGQAPPGVWLDDDRFLTQKTLGKVVVLNAASGKQELVVEIPPTHKPGEKSWETIGAMGFTPLGLQQPRFSLLPDGRVVYEADLVYFIDVAKKTWEKAAWRPLGHGFEYSAVPDRIKDVDPYSKAVTVTLRHRGKAIGTSENVWWTTAEKPRVVTAEGYLAVIERMSRPGNPVPLDTVRVWSAATGQWQTLDAWADSLIGWVK